MSRIKTPRGVEMRSTFGMREVSHSKVWLLSMNRAQARVFKWDQDLEDLVSIKSWRFPEGKKKGSDLVSDQPGRVFNARTFSRGGHQTAAPRHSYSNQERPQTHVAQKSVKQVCDWIETNQFKEKVTELICVAEPKLLGMLKKRLRKTNSNPLFRNWEKDLGWLEEEELRERLLTWLAGRPKRKKRFVPRPSGTHGVPNQESAHGVGF